MSADDQLALLSCAPPPKFPPGPIIRDALVEGKMRWLLRRAWGPGPAILWCGLNPSVADARRDDPTMLRIIGFSYRWGFGSLVMVNLYPFISSSPAVLRGWIERARGVGDVIRKNQLMVREQVRRIDVRVAAWGAGVAPEAEFDFMRAMSWDASEADPVWKCLGLNGGGSPVHPLARGKHRVPDDAKLIDFPFPEESY